MRRIIEVTSVTKRRIKEMILTLFPEVGYVRITRHRAVVLKRHWWSLKKERYDITETCVTFLPNKIAETATNYEDRIEYANKFNKHITNLMIMTFWSDKFDVVNYLWEQYHALSKLPTTDMSASAILSIETTTIGQLLPELHSLSNKRRLYNVYQDIKKSKKSTVESEKNKLLKKINKIKNVPARFNNQWYILHKLTLV